MTTRRITQDHTPWSAQQREILAWFDGSHPQAHRNLVIRARAGTGKTHTVLRGAYLSNAKSVRMMAFGARIAAELQDKLAKKRYGGSGRIKAMTLHAYGYHYFYDYDAAQVPVSTPRGFINQPRVEVDRQRDAKFLAKYQTETGEPVTRSPYKALLLQLIAMAKQVCPFVGTDPSAEWADLIALGMLQRKYACFPTQASHDAGFTAEKAARVALWVINKSVVEHTHTCSNEDQIFLPLRRGWIEPRHDLVIVDETQDMNTAQLEMVTRLVVPEGRIAIVGDDRQALYGFRGADTGALDRLKNSLNAIELPLTITHRCQQSIVAEVVPWVPDFQASPDAEAGVVYPDVPWEAMVANVQEGDFVLSRINAPLIDVVFEVVKQSKRAKILGRDGLKEQLRDTIDRLSCTSIPRLITAMGEKFDRDCEFANSHGASERDLQRIADMYQFLVSLAGMCSTIGNLYQTLEELIVGSKDPLEPSQYVSCATVHQAKGLEADRVFVLDDTLFLPRGEPQEEENIAYVAYTRARKSLWKCHRRKRS